MWRRWLTAMCKWLRSLLGTGKGRSGKTFLPRGAATRPGGRFANIFNSDKSVLLERPSAIDEIKRAMLDHTFDFKQEGVGGYKDDKGQIFIHEGRHRMNAALEIFEDIGDPAYVERLIEEGNIRELGPNRIDPGPLPRRK